MTTLKRQLDQLDVALGLDLLLDGAADLTIDDRDSDIKSLTGANSLASSLRRRLTTPVNSYARMVRTANGYEPVDLNYGCSLAAYLSAPLDQFLLTEIIPVAENAILQDSRIRDVSANVTETTLNGVGLEVRYLPHLLATLKAQPNTVGQFSIDDYSLEEGTDNHSFVIPIN